MFPAGQNFRANRDRQVHGGLAARRAHCQPRSAVRLPANAPVSHLPSLPPLHIMPRPIVASISISALQHNLAVARAHAPNARVWGVLKANGYGHGLERAMRGFAAADGLALVHSLDAAAGTDDATLAFSASSAASTFSDDLSSLISSSRLLGSWPM